MNTQEQTVIDDLFGKLKQAEAQSGSRDIDVERLIGDLVQRQPAAPYLMAQALLVQEQALKQLHERVQTLEQQAATRPQAGGGFLGSLFGAGFPTPPAPRPAASTRRILRRVWR